MAAASKPLNLNQLLVLLRSLVPNSETLDHAVRFLSTWSGSDKLFMVIQYTAKLIIPFFAFRARMQAGAGKRTSNPLLAFRARILAGTTKQTSATSSTAQSLAKLASVISDSRTLWRLFGSLPILQWLIGLERSAPPTRTLHTIERLQAWSLLGYYALEHASWFGSHSIGPVMTPRRIAKLGIWSTRFWAAYVVLQLVHLWEDSNLLKQRARTLMRTTAGPTDQEKVEMAAQKAIIHNDLLINLAYLPLTVHWSLEQGVFRNEFWVNLLGWTAGVMSFRAGWEATRRR